MMTTAERSKLAAMGLTASAALAGMTGAGVRAQTGAVGGVLEAIMLIAAALAGGALALASTPDPEPRTRVLEWDKRCVLATLGCAAMAWWAQAHGGAHEAAMWGIVAMGAVLGALVGGWRMARRSTWVDPAELLIARAGTRITGLALATAGTGKLPFDAVFNQTPKRMGASQRAVLTLRYERWLGKRDAGEGAWAQWWAHEMRDAVRGRSLTRWDLRTRAGTRARLDAIDAHVRRTLAKGWWSDDGHVSKEEAGAVVARERRRAQGLCRQERARWKANERARARIEAWVAAGLGAGALAGTGATWAAEAGWIAGPGVGAASSAAIVAMATSAVASALGARAGGERQRVEARRGVRDESGKARGGRSARARADAEERAL